MSHDPLGQCILDFAKNGEAEDIVVQSDLCDDDIIPSSYLHRSFDDMPRHEQVALKHCKGKVLDVGAGAGVHTKYLQEKGFDVLAIDTSLGAVEHMCNQGLSALKADFFKLDNQRYDTVLLLMNGAGIAGSLKQLPLFLSKCKSLLNSGGQVLLDSSDIRFLYQEEDGSYWMDLNAEYFGNFQFKMQYKNHETDWFDWLYVDFETLKTQAELLGFNIECLDESEDNHYLARLWIAS